MKPQNPLDIIKSLWGEWQKTSQPLQERASVLPLGKYEDGGVGLAWPGLLAAPAEGMVNFGRYGYDTPEAIRDNAASAFDVAGGAVTGGLGVGLAGGLVDNAVGSAGGKLFHGSPNKNLQHLKPSERGPLGPGIYATNSDNYAQRYAGDAGKVYELADESIDVFRGQGHRTDPEYFGWKDDVGRLIAAIEPEKRDAVLPIIENAWSGDGYPMYSRLRQAYGGDAGAQDLFRRAGFKGLSGQVDGPETVLFDDTLGALSNGLADNAVGSAGARARPFEMLLDDAADLPSRAPAEFQAGAKPLAYDLVQNGDDIGRIEMMINPQRGEAFIDNFVSGGGSNSLGVGGIRAIRDALRELHPEVKRFSGYRDVDMKTGGARVGADAAGYPNDRLQSFDFYANSPTGSSVPLAGETQDGEDINLTALLAQIFRGRP